MPAGAVPKMSRVWLQSPLGHVGDGPLASGMKDGHQDDRHAHFEHSDRDGYDSSTAHCHALDYHEVGLTCAALQVACAHDVSALLECLRSNSLRRRLLVMLPIFDVRRWRNWRTLTWCAA